MYRQQDPLLNPIATWGCAYIALAALWEDVSGLGLSAKQVLEIWLKNWKESDVDAESTMNDWQGVLDDFLAIGGPKILYLGHRPATYVPTPAEREILQFQRSDGYKHFVYGEYDYTSNIDAVKFDPTLDSLTVRTGWIISKRIFKVV